MTDYKEIIKSVHKYIASNYSLSNVAWENVKFENNQENYIRVNFSDSRVRNSYMNKTTLSVVVVVQIFTKEGNGMMEGALISDNLISLFQNKYIGDTRFQDCSIINIGESDDSGFYQRNMIAVGVSN